MYRFLRKDNPTRLSGAGSSSLFLLALVYLSCLTQASPDKTENALLIQADFAGLVMTGVAYSVSRDLDIYNVRPLIPLYDIAAASAKS